MTSGRLAKVDGRMVIETDGAGWARPASDGERQDPGFHANDRRKDRQLVRIIAAIGGER